MYEKYRPVSLLPVYGKVFRQHVFSSSENVLIWPKQSGFRPGDSCSNQLLSIADEILLPFDDGHEVRVFFRYI